MSEYSDNPRPRFHGRLLHHQQVTVGDALKLQGDIELKQEVERRLEMMVRERLQEAQEQADEILAQAHEAAAQLIDAAQKESAAIVADARREEDAIRKQAYEDGFKAGYHEGHEDAGDQVEADTLELLQGARNLMAHAYDARRKVFKQFEQDALAIIRHVCEKVIGRELQASPETVLAMIVQAIDSLHLSGKIRVVVSAELLQILKSYTDKTNAAVEGMERIELVSDPMLALHQIFVLTPESSFELTPAAQVEELVRPLAGQLGLEMPAEIGTVPELTEPVSETAESEASMSLESIAEPGTMVPEEAIEPIADTAGTEEPASAFETDLQELPMNPEGMPSEQAIDSQEGTADDD